ncbi:MAG: peptide-methionine (S)-S-oxide reductase [Lentisphaeria bacterium]|jgi:peptide-methionine (S)-S-oxide reductase
MARRTDLPSQTELLPGREHAIELSNNNHISGRDIKPPFPSGHATLVLGLGCFWGAERKFWQQQGVYTTAVGYAGGATKNPSYEEVCSGLTGHTEVVLVVYQNEGNVLEDLLITFWEAHDPTQGMRQGNDVGTQYRSAIYTTEEPQRALVQHSKEKFQLHLTASGFGRISTEINYDMPFYYAEQYHQQYLAKNPSGYCGLRGTGVCLV